MSKDFITRKQLIDRTRYIGNNLTPSDVFTTTDECIIAGADPDMLMGYTNNQYPIDDHIQKIPFELGPFTTSLNINRSWGIDVNFYPIDTFRMSFSVVPGSQGYNKGEIFKIYGKSKVPCIACKGYGNAQDLYLEVANNLGQITSIQLGKNLTNYSIAAVDILYTPTKTLGVRVNNISIYNEKFDFDPNSSYYAVSTGVTTTGGSLDNFTLSW